MKERSGPVGRQLIDDLARERCIVVVKRQVHPLLDERGGQGSVLLQPGEWAVTVERLRGGQPCFGDIHGEAVGFPELDAGVEALAARRVARAGVTIDGEELIPL